LVSGLGYWFDDSMEAVRKWILRRELEVGRGSSLVDRCLTSEMACETAAETAGMVVLGHYMCVAYEVQRDLARKAVEATGVACILASAVAAASTVADTLLEC
jgi:hypothetical protein